MTAQHRCEASVAIAIAVLAAVLAVTNRSYFSSENLNDLLLANVATLTAALGATLVIVSGQIDISIGSIFAVCSVIAGMAATHGLPVVAAGLLACAAGACLGAVNGVLVAYAGIPSIVVTLATMIGLRDALRWSTQGAWVENLPPGFQWAGLSQSTYPFAICALFALLLTAMSWAMRNTSAGRAVYATGSNPDAARLVGIDPAVVTCGVFVASGVLTALGALLNAVRFNQIPSNGGMGLELKVIASVVVGGAAITGGRGTVTGTLLGVVLLGAIGPALTFMGVSAYWERAIHGAIILAAVAADSVRVRRSGRSSVVAVSEA